MVTPRTEPTIVTTGKQQGHQLHNLKSFTAVKKMPLDHDFLHQLKQQDRCKSPAATSPTRRQLGMMGSFSPQKQLYEPSDSPHPKQALDQSVEEGLEFKMS